MTGAMSQSELLPEFEHPPVSEVALSIEYTPLANWSNSHALSYWKKIQNEYPNTEMQPVLPSGFENFEAGLVQPQIIPQLLPQLFPQLSHMGVMGTANRFWFLADPPNWLIQIQNGRFIFNWRQVVGVGVYPRYTEVIRPRFALEWDRFAKFLSENWPGQINITQCEVTYVNDIVKDNGWRSLKEATELFKPLCAGNPYDFLPTPETIQLNGSYLFPDRKGRLRYALGHGIRPFDKKEVVQLQLFARMRPPSSSNTDVLASIDIGREWVVRGFADITTEKAHLIWGRTR